MRVYEDQALFMKCVYEWFARFRESRESVSDNPRERRPVTSVSVGNIEKEFFSYTVSLIQFFLLTAFSLQLCLALAVYIKNVELKNVQYSFTKISALGWAIPVIIVGATLAAQSLEGYELEG
ncbi:uncharacterized protein TNCV_471421 [Trichonephila clavipes]|nr:uncharacterized protein TNCV_471421 [Trichonephila clavipes]